MIQIAAALLIKILKITPSHCKELSTALFCLKFVNDLTFSEEVQCFHFEGNFPNSGKSRRLPGNFREMKKFQEIPGNPKIMTYDILIYGSF